MLGWRPEQTTDICSTENILKSNGQEKTGETSKWAETPTNAGRFNEYASLDISNITYIDLIS